MTKQMEKALRRAEQRLARLSNARENGGRNIPIQRVLDAQAEVDRLRERYAKK
jgi:hypothetical protein